ncbi:hypothetical protein BaRGS_00003345 [Batillaria attramentaria]|uniref:Uncharacterized protein n=1 Tax=Batillaria attramentaria TaxID=370345 RepID=A0ABD0M1E2_9CAEN
MVTIHESVQLHPHNPLSLPLFITWRLRPRNRSSSRSHQSTLQPRPRHGTSVATRAMFSVLSALQVLRLVWSYITDSDDQKSTGAITCCQSKGENVGGRPRHVLGARLSNSEGADHS